MIVYSEVRYGQAKEGSTRNAWASTPIGSFKSGNLIFRGSVIPGRPPGELGQDETLSGQQFAVAFIERLPLGQSLFQRLPLGGQRIRQGRRQALEEPLHPIRIGRQAQGRETADPPP